MNILIIMYVLSLIIGGIFWNNEKFNRLINEANNKASEKQNFPLTLNSEFIKFVILIAPIINTIALINIYLTEE